MTVRVMTLRQRIALAFLLAVLFPVVAAAIVTTAVLPDQVDRTVHNQVNAAGTSAAATLAALCDTAHLAAETLGRQTIIDGPAAAARGSVAGGPGTWAGLVDRTGRLVASAGRPPGGNPQTAADCTTGPSAVPGLVGRARLQGATTLRQAIVVVPLSAVLHSVTTAGPGITLARDGRVVASTLPAAQAALVGRALRHSPTPLITAVVPAGPARPYTLVASAASPSYAEVQLVLVLVVLGTVGFAGWLAVRLSRLLTRPLTVLAEAADRVAAGDLSTSVPETSGDEVGRLAVAFNTMTAGLRRHIDELEHSRDEVRRGVDRLAQTLAGTHDLDRIAGVVLETAMSSLPAPAAELQMHVVPADTPRVYTRGQPVDPDAPTLVAPLVSHGDRLGRLTISGRPFTHQDELTLRSLAMPAAVAIENVLLHEEAQRLSVTDSLTALWNRRYLMLNLRQEVERATRYERSFAVLLLDVDRFKLVNDEHGHQRGDAVLVELSERVKGQIREVDTLARYGGEEFVLVLPETDADGVDRACARICAAVRQQLFRADGAPPLRVTVSIGAALYPVHGRSADELLSRADQALYRAKRAGRDQWRIAVDIGGPPVPSASGGAPTR